MEAISFTETPAPIPERTEADWKAEYVANQRARAERMNEAAGSLTGFDCEICRNRGFLYRADGDGYIAAAPCKCMAVRRSKRILEQSGLADMISRYTFDNWQTTEKWQAAVLEKAKGYAEDPEGWFAVCGKSGTGKTHICTAVCGALMERGFEVRYMLWRDAATRLKANATDDIAGYGREIEPYKTVQVLYIDDLFKTGNRQRPTTMDVNLAFEIINARYNTAGLITVISTELSMDDLMRTDEATASRIYERTKQKRNLFDFAKFPNWRMRAGDGTAG